MFSAEDAAICPNHGWMGHVFVHEAAHVVAAIDRGIVFNHVTISTPVEWAKNHPDGVALGGVHLDPPPSAWVMADPRKAYEFVIAGSLAEEGALGHWLPDGHAGDLRVFRQGAGLLDKLPQERLEEFIGAPIGNVVADMRAWLSAEYPRIRRVAEGLTGGAVAGGTLSYASGPWSLTYDEVVALAS